MLHDAYLSTAYLADDADGRALVARIGQRSADFDALLHRRGARCGVFITAWNPRSETTPAARNAAAAVRLAETIAAMGLAALPHRGVADGGGWPAEEGLFVLDLEAARAIEIAERFGQYAVVLVEPGAPARLLLTAIAQASRQFGGTG